MTRNQLERVERDGLPGEEIMRRAIEKVAANKPTMSQLIEQLWREYEVKAIVSVGERDRSFGATENATLLTANIDAIVAQHLTPNFQLLTSDFHQLASPASWWKSEVTARRSTATSRNTITQARAGRCEYVIKCLLTQMRQQYERC